VSSGVRTVFVLQEPTPYRTPHLARLGSRPELDVTVVYAAATVQRRTWTVDDDAIYLDGPSLPLSRVLHHDYPLTPSVWPLLGRLRPDAVVVGGWSTSATQLAILWCRTHRVPYLLTSDNHLSERRPAWVRVVKRLVLPRVVPQAAGWLVPGSGARAHILRYGADPSGVVDFPLTVDVPALVARADELVRSRAELRRALGVDAESVLVLGVGRLIEFKAPDVLLRAVARARSRTERKLHLVLAGNGPLEDELRREAAALGGGTTFAGFVEGRELLELYAAADVFALLSRREPWGVVVNEAMCFGLPLVLSSAVGAGGDLLRDGVNGRVVPVDDVEAAGDALAALAESSDLRREMGAASRELIGPWGYERGADDLVALLRRVTAGRRPR
jgi:glycosyltransferase involved in cell wall biosynthesis